MQRCDEPNDINNTITTNIHFFYGETFKNSVNFVLQSLPKIADASLYYGNSGISLSLFEWAKFTNDEKYEEYAYELLKNVLRCDLSSYKAFATGSAGVGYLLEYLIKHHFLEADYDELYFEMHSKILQEIEIKADDFEYNKYDYADFLFFILRVAREEEREKFKNIIILNILGHLLFFEIFDMNQVRAADFFCYSAKILSICNSTQLERKYSSRFLVKIMHVLKNISDPTIVCNNPAFSSHLLIYGLRNGDTGIIEMGQKLTSSILPTLQYRDLNFKQKIDLSFNMFRIYFLNKDLDYRPFANQCLSSIYGQYIGVDGNNIKNIHSDGMLKVSYAEGLCRFLLLGVFWKEIETGIISDDISGLFNC